LLVSPALSSVDSSPDAASLDAILAMATGLCDPLPGTRCQIGALLLMPLSLVLRNMVGLKGCPGRSDDWQDSRLAA
jgi:hypothetical protein